MLVNPLGSIKGICLGRAHRAARQIRCLRQGSWNFGRFALLDPRRQSSTQTDDQSVGSAILRLFVEVLDFDFERLRFTGGA